MNFENINPNDEGGKEVNQRLESYANDAVEKFVGIANGTYSNPEVAVRELM